jgi:hypothetical protein
MARSQRLRQVAATRQRKDASRMRDAVALDDRATIMNRIVREENGLEHFRRGDAIDLDAGLDGFLQLDRLLDGDQGADPDIRKSFGRLHNDFDIFPLLVRRLEQWEISKLSQEPPQLRLENHQHRDREEGGECRQQPVKDREVKKSW